MEIDKATFLKAAQDKNSLGNMLVREGVITQFELGQLLVEYQAYPSRILIGQFFVEKNLISEEKLQLLLNRQDADRNGGVHRKHVTCVMDIARETQGRVDSCTTKLLASMNGFGVKDAG